MLGPVLAVVAFGADRGEEILLWPNGAPGSEGITSPEVFKFSPSAANRRLPENFTVTHYPSIFIFLPPKEKATGAAVVVAPGGGHTQLTIDKEGWEVADWLNAHGIAAFVLKYRLSKAVGVRYTLAGEDYADAARSVRLVRSRAREWGVDPERIGFLGFSAGGEVAEMIETKFDGGKLNAVDSIERVGSRPDFVILICPSYRPGSLPPERDSREQTAKQNSIAQNKLFPVAKNDPPVFMVCADDEPSDPTPTVKFYLELQAVRVPAELHIYSDGTHGFSFSSGLRPTNQPQAPVESWPDRLKDWLADRGFSKQ